jgi:hypothetical protein
MVDVDAGLEVALEEGSCGVEGDGLLKTRKLTVGDVNDVLSIVIAAPRMLSCEPGWVAWAG